MLRHRVVQFAACLLTAFAFVGCDNSSSNTTSTGTPPEGGTASTDPIKIGHFASKSGDTATFGLNTDRGILLAMKEINARGGVMGRPIKVLTEDDRSLTPEARTAVQKLIERDKVVALLGEVASSRSKAAAPLAQDAKIPMLSPASTNPDVTQVGDYIFRACFTDEFQGEAIAKFAMDSKDSGGLGLKKFAILYPNNSDYGMGLRQYITEAVKARGGEIVADESYAEKADKDFNAQLTKIKAANPDAVFVTGYYTEAALIAKQAEAKGLNVPLIGGDGWESDILIKSGGKAIEGDFFTTHVSLQDPREEVQTFLRTYRAEYDAEPDAMSVLGYDAMMLMADAIERAGSTDGTAIRDALAATKNFKGVGGEITMDRNRNARKPLVVLTPKDGAFQFVTSIDPD